MDAYWKGTRKGKALLGFILIVGCANAAGQGSANRLSAPDVFNIQYADDPQISPSGTKIVYVRHFNDINTDSEYSNLWIIDFDGSNNRPLTNGNCTDTVPRWSPDGSRIAYLSGCNSTAQLYVRWLDSGAIAKVTNDPFCPTEFVWSPDGKQIAFRSFIAGEGRRLADLPSPPAGAKWAGAPEAYDEFPYRWDGKGYLKPGFTQILIVAADGGAARQLTNGSFPHGGNVFDPGRITWTPDGKYLLTTGNFTPDFAYEPLDMELYAVSVADGSTQTLTGNRKGPWASPDVSPDGKRIAYIGFDDRSQGHQTTHLYVMNRDGSNPQVLTPKLDRDVQGPRWTADGTAIYFTYDDQGDTKLAYSSLDGNIRVVAEHLGSGGSSIEGGVSFTLSRNGAFAFTYESPYDPGDIAVSMQGDSHQRVLTSLDEVLFQQKKLGQVEEFWFNSSLDGRKVQGWIVKPPDFDASKKYPLILEIHGGPFENYGDRFDTIKQVWAALGYVVVYLNPRGSTSYGDEFANLIHHAYPGDDFYDLNSGVDAVIARGYIDADNLFVTGGSGGGVLTCWMIGRTTRFRAAASLFPVINWYSWALTTDLSAFATRYWFPGPPWEHVDDYYKRSVISNIKNVTTPTLLLVGEEDYRTPLSEAEQFYGALKLRRIDSVLIRVPEEPHGLGERPSHTVDAALYIVGWFNLHRRQH